jgi:hypothetical protein
MGVGIAGQVVHRTGSACGGRLVAGNPVVPARISSPRSQAAVEERSDVAGCRERRRAPSGMDAL